MTACPCSAFVSCKQMTSGFSFCTNGTKSPFLCTARIPFTFHEMSFIPYIVAKTTLDASRRGLKELFSLFFLKIETAGWREYHTVIFYMKPDKTGDTFVDNLHELPIGVIRIMLKICEALFQAFRNDRVLVILELFLLLLADKGAHEDM